MEKTAEGRTITEREQELFLAWLAMYPAIMEIKIGRASCRERV